MTVERRSFVFAVLGTGFVLASGFLSGILPGIVGIVAVILGNVALFQNIRVIKAHEERFATIDLTTVKIPKGYGVKPVDQIGIFVTGLFLVAIPVWWIWWSAVALLSHAWVSLVAAQGVPWLANWANIGLRAYFQRDLTFWRSVQSAALSHT